MAATAARSATPHGSFNAGGERCCQGLPRLYAVHSCRASLERSPAPNCWGCVQCHCIQDARCTLALQSLLSEEPSGWTKLLSATWPGPGWCRAGRDCVHLGLAFYSCGFKPSLPKCVFLCSSPLSASQCSCRPARPLNAQ